MWQVTAQSQSGREYVYRVNAPENASKNAVTCAAYAAHGSKLRSGELDSGTEKLGPFSTAEWI